MKIIYRKIKYFKTSDLISEGLNSELNKSNINDISTRLGNYLNKSVKKHLTSMLQLELCSLLDWIHQSLLNCLRNMVLL